MGYLDTRARNLARRVHTAPGVARGAARLERLERVAIRLPDERLKAVALLSEAVQIGDLGVGDLLAAGLPSDLATAVVAVNRRPDEDEAAYQERVAANPLARSVRAASDAEAAAEAATGQKADRL